MVGVTAAFAASIPNGDFEKGNFSGWKEKSTGGGEWSIYTAKDRVLPGPPNGPSAPKPVGKYASRLVQEEPSTNYLTRSLTVPSGATHLTVKLFWVNRGGPPGPVPGNAAYWRFPGTWDVSGARIQYFMLDLVKASAGGFTTKKSDILATLFKPKIGSTSLSLIFSPRKRLTSTLSVTHPPLRALVEPIFGLKSVARMSDFLVVNPPAEALIRSRMKYWIRSPFTSQVPGKRQYPALARSGALPGTGPGGLPRLTQKSFTVRWVAP
ncbi:MAG: hypothetical protein ACKOPI_01260, partial [bacterium]